MTWQEFETSDKELILEYDEKYDKTPNEELKKLCMDEDPSALYELASRFFLGCDGVQEDDKRALELYRRVLQKQRHVGAINRIGQLYEHGIAGEESAPDCVKFYEIGSRWGGGDATEHLGLLYEAGNHVEKDLDKAIELFHLAVSQGNKHAYFNLGDAYEQKGDNEKAKFFLQKAIETKSEYYACILLGDIFEREGEGQKAFQLYHMAYSHDITDGAVNMGMMFWKGDLLKEDNAQAFKWFTVASQKGDKFSNYYLGILYADGIPNVLEKDVEKALSLLSDVPEYIKASAFTIKGDIYQKQHKVGEARKWYEQAILLGSEQAKDKLQQLDAHPEQEKHQHLLDMQDNYSLEQLLQADSDGDEDAAYYLAEAYRKGTRGAEQNAAKAEYFYNKVIGLGGTKAQFGNVGIARIYYYGQGVEIDYNKAFQYCLKAAEDGEANACGILSDMYENGQGVEKDSEKARYWCKIAADNGNYNCCRNLGNDYLFGKIDGKQNLKQAVKYLSVYWKAVPEDRWCNWIMGQFYWHGVAEDGVIVIEQNIDKAIHCLEVAGSRGHAEAYDTLGKMFLEGDGIEANPSKAVEYYEKALELGNIWSAGQVAALHLFPEFQGQSWVNINRGVDAAKLFIEKGEEQHGIKEMLMEALLIQYDNSDVRSQYAIEGYTYLLNKLCEVNLVYSNEEAQIRLRKIIKYLVEKMYVIYSDSAKKIENILDKLECCCKTNPYIKTCSIDIIGENYYLLGKIWLDAENLEKAKALFEKAAWSGYAEAEKMLSRFRTSLFGNLVFK